VDYSRKTAAALVVSRRRSKVRVAGINSWAAWTLARACKALFARIWSYALVLVLKTLCPGNPVALTLVLWPTGPDRPVRGPVRPTAGPDGGPGLVRLSPNESVRAVAKPRQNRYPNCFTLHGISVYLGDYTARSRARSLPYLVLLLVPSLEDFMSRRRSSIDVSPMARRTRRTSPRTG